MRPVPAGHFVMGSNAHYPEERPEHEEQVGAFWIDEHPVTNAEFRRFVLDTGYRTTAETAPAGDDFPDADPADLTAGSLLFRPTSGPVPLDDWRRWWHWTPGANWRAPEGPGSSLGGRERHPVVHVSYEDALAYAGWAGKQLPTEVEWEYAARAGGTHTAYAWGEDFMPRGKIMANTWQGPFPWRNDAPAGKDRTTPIGTYPPNNWHLVDMIGNVWEWTSTPWTDNHATHLAHHESCCAPHTTADADGLGESDRRVMKGGSHLCAPSYCARYRPAARQGQAVRSSTSHLGFRCITR
ncbi:MAG TPA: formylglycine-generating enzyme family protein [Jatrophihabitantaceae bacterium]|jgi:formylglycine-generating enzyme required for sulfatase activity